MANKVEERLIEVYGPIVALGESASNVAIGITVSGNVQVRLFDPKGKVTVECPIPDELLGVWNYSKSIPDY